MVNDPNFKWKSYLIVDEIDGKLKYIDKLGDYREYRGGLNALKEGIEKYKKLGKIVTFYTDPYRVYDMTEIGKKWALMNEDGTYYTPYEAYRVCPDNKDVWEYFAETMERLARETGIDGIRFDEYGIGGWVCYNPNHCHVFF